MTEPHEIIVAVSTPRGTRYYLGFDWGYDLTPRPCVRVPITPFGPSWFVWQAAEPKKASEWVTP